MMDLEVIHFLVVMGIGVIVTILYGVILMKKSLSLKKSLIQSVVVSFVYFCSCSYWWYTTQSDPFSKVFGVTYYIVAGFSSLLVLLFILFIMRRKSPKNDITNNI